MKNETVQPTRCLVGKRFIANAMTATCLFITAFGQAQTWDLNDYSEYSTADQYTPEYPDQTKQINYPEFSWDKVPRWLAFRGPSEMTTENVESIANHYQLVLIEKQNKQGLATNEEGTIYSAQQLKAINPNIHCYFYWNSWIQYGGYAASAEFEDNADDWAEKNEDGSIFWFKDLYMVYDYSSPGLREWWVDTALEMAQHPDIDGVFADKVHGKDGLFFDQFGEPESDYIDMLDTLAMVIPEDKTYVGNTLRNERPGGNREHMIYFDSSYFERWEVTNKSVNPAQSTAEAIAVSIQLAREALSKGKIVNLQTGPPDGYSSTQQHLADNVEFPLAVFLIIAEEYAYFSYQGGVADVPAYEDWLWNTAWVDEFSRPLGEPFGPPVRNGYVYTRSFEHVDVYLDLESHSATLTWFDDPRPIPGDNTPPSPNPAGFSIPPTAISSSEITMTAIIGSDASGTVEYRFVEQTGNPGGTSSAWQSSATYVDDGLSSDTEYRYVVRMRDAENNVGASSIAVTTSTFSNGSLLSQDIGSVSAAGSVSESGGTYTINGSGSDIWGTADEFQFVFDSLDGDGEIVARVASVDNTNVWAKAGVMIRESLSADSVHAMTVVTPSNGVSFQRRTSAGGNSAHTTIGGVTAPQWLRITRSGNTFTSAYSLNGVSWTNIGSTTVNMSNSVYIGMVVTSHNDGTLCTAVMDNVAISNGSSSDPDLIAHWSFDDGSGSLALDTSGNGHHGTVSNGNWVNGTDGGALEFNGSNSQVTLPTSAFDEIDDEVTIGMWVYGANTQPRNDTVFFAGDGANNRALNIHLPWNSSIVYWDAGNSGASYDRINNPATASDFMGQWNHWVFTKNATTGEMAIYLNGSLWHSGVGKVRSIPSIAAASIGSQGSGSYYDGMIDDVLLFKSELSAQEILDLYNSY
ncbi:putative glycoside hydrolase [Puniceicoccaceae bacterium K14]|nr:putative glycoside hydrolase [Puniceicoccaceae bacterium K14]